MSSELTTRPPRRPLAEPASVVAVKPTRLTARSLLATVPLAAAALTTHATTVSSSREPSDDVHDEDDDQEEVPPLAAIPLATARLRLAGRHLAARTERPPPTPARKEEGRGRRRGKDKVENRDKVERERRVVEGE
uniref:Uncharacterized protein n=1 Tax=Oryza meridionalis TaxID=40149 RepID=A0A0E0CR08_9ORYZ